MRVEIECNFCGETLTTTSTALAGVEEEVKSWNAQHDRDCPGPVPREVKLRVDGLEGTAVLPKDE